MLVASVCLHQGQAHTHWVLTGQLVAVVYMGC
jgi:hypothetical protein